MIEVAGLSIALVGVAILASASTSRNGWLTIVGIIDAFISFAVATLYGGFPLVELYFGGTGTTAYEALGLQLERWQVPVLAATIFLVTTQALIVFLRLFAGLTRFQRAR